MFWTNGQHSRILVYLVEQAKQVYSVGSTVYVWEGVCGSGREQINEYPKQEITVVGLLALFFQL